MANPSENLVLFSTCIGTCGPTASTFYSFRKACVWWDAIDMPSLVDCPLKKINNQCRFPKRTGSLVSEYQVFLERKKLEPDSYALLEPWRYSPAGE